MSSKRNRLAIAALAVASGITMQATAAPIFTFTENGGFTDDVGMAKYSDPVTGDASLIPEAGPLYSTMQWVGGRETRSSLKLATATSPTPLLTDTWATISTLSHDNKIIPGANSWFGQNIWGRFIISDADGGVNRVLDSQNVITLNMDETQNHKACPEPNPIGTMCDDFFTITTPINDLYFSANDGSQWLATFRFANLVNAFQFYNMVYTGEGMTGSIDVQVLVTSAEGIGRLSSMSAFSDGLVGEASAVGEVPEPASLIMLCLGLAGLGIARQRGMRTIAPITAKAAH